MSPSSSLPVLVVGGGIGGLAAALALAAKASSQGAGAGADVGEIGAGVQLGPNAFAAFDALGVGGGTGPRGLSPTKWS